MRISLGSVAGVWGVASRTLTADPFSRYSPATFTRASIVLTATATSTVLNATESGLLIQVSVVVTAAVTGTAPVASIFITVDGGTVHGTTIYNGATSFDPTAVCYGMTFGAANVIGQAANDSLMIPVWCRYKTSILVQLVVSTASTTGTVSVGADRYLAS